MYTPDVLLRIKHETDGYDDGESGTIKYEQVELIDLVKEIADYALSNVGLMRVSAAQGKTLSPQAIAFLKQHGWVHAATVKKVAEKKVLEQEFYLLDRAAKATMGLGYYRQPKFQSIDLSNITDDQIAQLANGAQIVQVVSTKSVLSDSALKKVAAKKKQKEEAAQRSKETAAKREARKKQREIEKAKKFLQEVGELPHEEGTNKTV